MKNITEILPDNEVVKIWFENLLAEKGKNSLDELTAKEIAEEIEETRGTISNEKMWAHADPIHFEHIATLEAYISELKDLLEKAKRRSEPAENTDFVRPSEVLDKINRIEDATLDYYRGNITRKRYEQDIKSIRKAVSDYVTRTEPSDTDFALIKKLAAEFEPSIQGIITSEEKELVTNTLELGGRNVRELRNLRNMFVMLSGMSTKSIDYISAVTCVIDEAIVHRGGEA